MPFFILSNRKLRNVGTVILIHQSISPSVSQPVRQSVSSSVSQSVTTHSLLDYDTGGNVGADLSMDMISWRPRVDKGYPGGLSDKLHKCKMITLILININEHI